VKRFCALTAQWRNDGGVWWLKGPKAYRHNAAGLMIDLNQF